MAQTVAPPAFNVGFLTIFHEVSGYLGGYLVTNAWGRPLEFRLSTAVQPNRVQQILYGGTLQPYICADLIGKTLVDKTATAVQLVVTDREPVLELRRSLEVPVAWVAAPEDPLVPVLANAGAQVELRGQGSGVRGQGSAPARVFCHPHFLGDLPFLREALERLEGMIDLAEPFARIREAIGEARKLGVTARGG